MAIKRIEIEFETPVLIGAPRVPMEGALVESIADAVSMLPDVVEAHLPQMFAVGVMQEPSQVIVTAGESSPSILWPRLDEALAEALPELAELHVWIMAKSHELLDDIRRTHSGV